ncbi:MAG: 4-hydroxy-tetrahydrodipicolinate reductase, partial [Clostridia bacterium]|nr:4-hydroxy-tetrahydrodipicolinate reductase [Clostridia bacterium]
MTKILLFGYGKMGKMLEDVINASEDCEYMGSIDIDQLADLPYMGKTADVIIDFSHPNMLAPLCEYAKRTETALVSGTTGYTADDMQKLKALAETVPVLYSSNYSLGIAIMKMVLAKMHELIPDDFDIELIETHHNKK